MAQHTRDIQTLGEQKQLEEEGDKHPMSEYSDCVCLRDVGVPTNHLNVPRWSLERHRPALRVCCSAKLSNHFLLVQIVMMQRTSRICGGTSRRCDAHWKSNQMVSNALVNNYNDRCDSLIKTGRKKKASDLFLVKRRLRSTFNLQPETSRQLHMA